MRRRESTDGRSKLTATPTTRLYCTFGVSTIERGSREEDLSTEYPQAQQDPRLSQADEHPRGPNWSSRSGGRRVVSVSPPSLTVAMPHRLSRLSRSSDFQRIYRRGHSTASRFLVLYSFKRPPERGDEGPRLGLSVSKKMGGAVVRNRVKRLLREAFMASAQASVRGVRSRADRAPTTARPPRSRERRREGTGLRGGPRPVPPRGPAQGGRQVMSKVFIALIRVYQYARLPCWASAASTILRAPTTPSAPCASTGVLRGHRARRLAPSALQPLQQRRLRPRAATPSGLRP